MKAFQFANSIIVSTITDACHYVDVHIGGFLESTGI